MNRLVVLLTMCIATNMHAQSRDTSDWLLPNQEHKDIGLLFGVHQFRYTFVELGMSASKSKGGCAFGSYFYGTSLSAEYNPFQQRAAFTFSCWTSLATLITLGANVHTYTDFDRYNLGLKPFIGIGPGNISLTYGYNFQLIDKGLTAINRHCFSLRYYLPLRSVN